MTTIFKKPINDNSAMAIERFYDALNSNRYDKEELGRLVFRLEPNGPRSFLEKTLKIMMNLLIHIQEKRM